MEAIFRDDCWWCDSGFVENFGEVSWIVNSIPWIEAFEQIRPYILDRAPECVTPRLEEIRSPCGHRQLAARSNATPEFTHSSCHVGHKENSKHTHNGIEAFGRKPEGEHISDLKFDIAKSLLNSFASRQLQKLFSKVNSYDVPRRCYSIETPWLKNCKRAV